MSSFDGILFNCEPVDIGPPVIRILTFSVDESSYDPDTNPVIFGSTVTANLDVLYPLQIIYKWYSEDQTEPIKESNENFIELIDYDPSPSAPSNYVSAGENLKCKVTVSNNLGVDSRDEIVVIVNATPPEEPTSLDLDYLKTIIDADPPLGEAVVPGDEIQLSYKSTFTPGNPDVSSITTIINSQSYSGRDISYTVTGNEENCSLSLSTLTYSNFDEQIPGSSETTANFSDTILYSVYGSQNCTGLPGRCCTVGEYDPSTGITSASCVQSFEENCSGVFEEGESCPDCSSDPSIGLPCCPEYPTGRCCSGSSSSQPCFDNAFESECSGEGQVWEKGLECSDCNSSSPNAGYCGCLGTCCKNNEPCGDNFLEHQCSNTFFPGRLCSDCEPLGGGDVGFENTCCDEFIPFNGQNIVYFVERSEVVPGDTPYPDGYYSVCSNLSTNPNGDYNLPFDKENYDRTVWEPTSGGQYSLSRTEETPCNQPIIYSRKEFPEYNSCEKIRLGYQTDVVDQFPSAVTSPRFVKKPDGCNMRDYNRTNDSYQSSFLPPDKNWELLNSERHPCKINGLCACFKPHPEHPFCVNKINPETGDYYRLGPGGGILPDVSPDEDIVDLFSPENFTSPFRPEGKNKFGSSDPRRACEFAVCQSGGYTRGYSGPRAGTCALIGCFSGSGNPVCSACNSCTTANKNDPSDTFCFFPEAQVFDLDGEGTPDVFEEGFLPPQPFCCGGIDGGEWDAECAAIARTICQFTDRYTVSGGAAIPEEHSGTGYNPLYVEPSWTYLFGYYYSHLDTVGCVPGFSDSCVEKDDNYYMPFDDCMRTAGFKELFDRGPRADNCPGEDWNP